MTEFHSAQQQNNHMTTVSAYDILGIPPGAPQKDVHTALRRLALAWHPDRVPSWRRGEATLRFQAIMDAYNKLRTPDARKAYDAAAAGMARRPLGVKQMAGRITAKVRARAENDNVPLATRARAWLKALETVFWPIRKHR